MPQVIATFSNNNMLRFPEKCSIKFHCIFFKEQEDNLWTVWDLLSNVSSPDMTTEWFLVLNVLMEPLTTSGDMPILQHDGTWTTKKIIYKNKHIRKE